MSRTRALIYAACTSFGLLALAGAGHAQEYFGPETPATDAVTPEQRTGTATTSPDPSSEPTRDGPTLETLVPRGQGQRPESLSAADRERLTPLTRPIEQAPTPDAAVAAYARGLAAEPECVLLEQVYLQRMIDLGTPHLAEAQAEDLVRRNQEDGLAWAVLAFTSGEANDTSAALAEIATALSYAPDDEFVQQTAGKLLAWYDVLGKPEEIQDEQLKQALVDIRQDFQNRATFAKAYADARAAYAQGAGVLATDAGDQAGTDPAAMPRTVEGGTPEWYEEDDEVASSIAERRAARDDADVDDDGYTTIRTYEDAPELNFGLGYSTQRSYVTPLYTYPDYGYTYSRGYADYWYPPCTGTIIVPRTRGYVLRDRSVHRYLHFRIGHRERDYSPSRRRIEVHIGAHSVARTPVTIDQHSPTSGRTATTPRTTTRYGGLRFYNPSAPTRLGAEPWRYGMAPPERRSSQGSRGNVTRSGPRPPVSSAFPNRVQRTPSSSDTRTRAGDRNTSGIRRPATVRPQRERATPPGTRRTAPPRPSSGVRRSQPPSPAAPRTSPASRAGRSVAPPRPGTSRVAPPSPRRPQPPQQQPAQPDRRRR